MKFTTMKLADILPYENNPRKNDDAVAAVAESIKQCGYIQPIVVDENNVILAGHTRAKALYALGKEEVNVLIAEGLTEEQKRKYRLLDNKTSEFAGWDYEKLDFELATLDFEGFDFGFEIQDADLNIDDFFEDAAPKEKKAKTAVCPECGHEFEI